MKNTFKILYNLLFVMLIASVAITLFNVGLQGFILLVAIGFSLTFLNKGQGEVVAAVGSLDLSALSSELKDRALADTTQILTTVMVDGLGFTDYFETLSNVIDEIPLNQLVINSVLQPGGKDTFAPTANAVKFKNRIGKTRPMKVDLTFTPTQILGFYKSYLGKVAGKKIDPYEIPFEQFILDMVIKAAQRDIRVSALFKGVYNPSGTAAADTCDGLGTKVTNELGTNIPSGNASTGAAVTAANAYDEVNKIVEIVYANPDYRDVPMVCLLSPTNMKHYNDDYKSTFGALPYNTEYGKQKIDGTNITFKEEVGLTGSDRIIITPQENLFWITNEEAVTNGIIVERRQRNIDILMDINCAPEFGIAEIIWCNNYSGIV